MSALTTKSHPLSDRTPVYLSIWAWGAITLVGLTAFFWDGLVALLDAWSRPEYSHGPIIPLIAAFLLLREIHRRQMTLEDVSRWPGIVVLSLGLVVGLLGNLAQIPYLITYGLIVSIAGLILTYAGLKNGLRFWPAIVYLGFMLPLPNFMYWKLSTSLQFISSRIGVDMIQMIGIPVYLQGNIIDLGVYKLQVAEACSGLNYLFPLMSFGFLFAVLYRGPVWHKVLLFVSTIPITVLMNSFRIGVIGVLVNQYGIEQAEGFLHFFEGWVIFVACLAILYMEAVLLQWTRRKPESAANILDLDTRGIFKVAKAAQSARAHKSFMLPAIAVCALGLMWQAMPGKSAPTISREPLSLFPMKLEEWQGTSALLDVNVQVALGADEYLLSDFTKGNSPNPVNLFAAYYHSITDGTGTHSPEVCIPGGGWEVSRWQQARINDGKKEFTVNRAIIQKGTDRRLVYYWFERGGKSFASEYAFKLNTVWDSATTGRSDGALVRLITTISAGEPETAAEERLETFAKSLSGVLKRYIPD